jgi:hypothetical protein
MNITLRYLCFPPCGTHLVTDRGILRLPSVACQLLGQIFASRAWISQDGEHLVCLSRDYEATLQFVIGNSVIFLDDSGRFSVLQLSSSTKSMEERI